MWVLGLNLIIQGLDSSLDVINEKKFGFLMKLQVPDSIADRVKLGLSDF